MSSLRRQSFLLLVLPVVLVICMLGYAIVRVIGAPTPQNWLGLGISVAFLLAIAMLMLRHNPIFTIRAIHQWHATVAMEIHGLPHDEARLRVRRLLAETEDWLTTPVAEIPACVPAETASFFREFGSVATADGRIHVSPDDAWLDANVVRIGVSDEQAVVAERNGPRISLLDGESYPGDADEDWFPSLPHFILFEDAHRVFMRERFGR